MTKTQDLENRLVDSLADDNGASARLNYLMDFYGIGNHDKDEIKITVMDFLFKNATQKQLEKTLAQAVAQLDLREALRGQRKSDQSK